MESTASYDVTTNSSNGKESSYLNELYLVSAILACLAVIGTAGNAIVIYVFNRKKDNAVSTFFILTLAFVDFATCIIVIPFIIFMLNVGFETHSDFVCKTGFFLYFANLLFSAFVMAAIAIDRYFCICHPFRSIMTVPRAKFLVVCMAVIASAVGVCFLLTVGIFKYAHTDGGSLRDGETPGSTEGRIDSTSGTYQSEIAGDSYGLEVIMTQSSVEDNPVSGPTETSSTERSHAIIYTEYCVPNNRILSMKFQAALRTFYFALYLFCFLAVLILYILIYRSVLLQRKNRRHLQKKGHLPLTRTTQTSIAASCHGNRTLADTSPDDVVLDSPSQMIRPRQPDERSSPLSAESAATRAANLKTAAMLFVVTIVFALSYLPNILMNYGLIPFNRTVFHMYFVNSVANPIIYSFMNRNFREKVKKLISRR